MKQNWLVRQSYTAFVYALIFSLAVTPALPRAAVAAAPERADRADDTAALVTLTKSAAGPSGKARPEAGDTLDYRLTVTNAGGDAAGVVITDTLDPVLSMVPGSLEVTPLAFDQSLATEEDEALEFKLDVFDADGDALSYTITGAPAHGQLSGTAPNLTYTPDTNFSGSDGFLFTVNDGSADSQPAAVSILVAQINDPPVCQGLAMTTAEDDDGSLGASCSDDEENPLTYEIASQPAHGSASVTGSMLLYTPDADFHGADSFTYRANDGILDSNTAQVDVTVMSVDDTPVAYPQSLTTAEDTVLAVTLAGEDADQDALSYSVTAGPDHGSLAGSAPELTYTPDADYNGADGFTFEACEGGGALLCGIASISIQVDAVNDPPAFTAGNDVTVDEDAAAQVLAGWASSITAGPANEAGQSVSFQITTNDNPALFSAGPSVSPTGTLTFTPAADANGEAQITLRLQDDGGTTGGGLDSSAPQSFTIRVNDINDAPVVADASFSIDENSPNGTPVGTVNVSDAELSQAQTFRITAGDPTGVFQINPATGALSVAASALLDYESGASYTLTVRVTDNGSPELSGDGTITIALNDLDEAPAVIAAEFLVDENSPAGSAVGTVTFGNQDAGQAHVFAITGGNTGGAFAIEPSTGAITVAGSAVLDYEETPTFTLTIRVTDDSAVPHTGENQVLVRLNDRNEAPVVAEGTFSLPENSASGTSAGSATFSDPDAAQTHTFTITAGNSSGAFAIDPASGAITVATSSALDFESTPAFSLTVRVEDSAGLAGTGVVTVQLSDVNEAPLVNPSAFDVAENSPAVEPVGSVTFNDQDAGQTHTYAITAGNTGGAFSIHTTTGAITVASSAAINFEAAPTFSLTVRVTDNLGLSGEGQITIDLIDVNEAPGLADISFSLDENSANDTTVGGLTVADPDSGQSHTFAITAGNASGAFAIDPAAGMITVADGTKLNYEVVTSYVLTVLATDDGTPALSDSATIMVNILDVDEAPVVMGESYETVGNTLLQVGASATMPAPRIFVQGNLLNNDSDPESAGVLTTAFGSASTGAVVTVSSNGSFTYLPPAGKRGTDTFTYTVTDAGGFSSTGTVTITLKSMVWYVNDAGPGNSGRSTQPFLSIAQAQAIAGTEDTIYVYVGSGNYMAKITLQGSQRLIGQGAALTIDEAVNGVAAPLTLLAATGSKTYLTETGDVAVTVSNPTAVLIAGMNIYGDDKAIAVTSSTTGAITIRNNITRSVAMNGIEMIVSSGTLTASVQNNSLTSTKIPFYARGSGYGNIQLNFSNNTSNSDSADAVLIDGGVTVTGFLNNTVTGTEAGNGFLIKSAVFDATPGGAYNEVLAGTIRVGSLFYQVGLSAVRLENVSGDLRFGDMDLYAKNGAALYASSGSVYTGSTGLRLQVSDGNTATIRSWGGPALELSKVTAGLPLDSVTSSGSPTVGISLSEVTGSVTITSGSITGAAGTAFKVSKGNAAVTFPGAITNTIGRSVEVTDTTGGSVTLTGSIQDTGAGVYLNNNPGASFSFSGGLSIKSGANAAFTATGGGTVTVTGEANTLETTAAAALTVINTTIGAGGLNFRSITARNAASGIVLNTTGLSGGLTVTGDTSGGSSGGSLTTMTSDCISLTGAAKVSLHYMVLNGCGGMGIRATSVTDFSFTNGSVLNAGNQDDEHAVRFELLKGAAKIESATLSGMADSGIQLTNSSDSLSLTIRNVTMTLNSAAYGEDGLQLRLSGAATARVLVDNTTFTALQRDGIDALASNQASLDLTVQGSRFTNNAGPGGATVKSESNAAVRLDAHGNTFQNTLATALNLTSAGSSHLDASLASNNISHPAPPAAQNGFGLRLSQEETSTMTVAASNNTIGGTAYAGIQALSRLATSGSGLLNLTLRSNQITAPLTSGEPGAYITVQDTNNTVCLDSGYSGVLGGNTVAGKDVEGFFLYQENGQFQLAGWNTTAHTMAAAHVQAYNPGSSAYAYASGNFTATAAGACPLPVPPVLPQSVALSGGAALAEGASQARLAAPAASPRADGSEPLSVTLGRLPAGRTVTITFQATIANPLPAGVLQVSSQASAAGDNFEMVLSDDPSTTPPADPTITLLYRPPAAPAETFTTPEDTPLHVAAPGLLTNVTAATGYEGSLSADLASDPAAGTAVVNPDGSFVYTPAANLNGPVTFAYRAGDGQSASAPALVTIHITAVNDPPVLNALAPFALLPVGKGQANSPGSLVAKLLASGAAASGDPFTDVDEGAYEGIAVTSADTAHGAWQYSLDGGGSWLGLGTPSARAARLLAADGNTRIRFVPSAGWAGTVVTGITFRAWDRSAGTNGTAADTTAAAPDSPFSLESAAASVTVVNQADLAVQLTASPNPVEAGSLLDYTLVVTNTGPGTASGVVVTASLPTGIRYVSDSAGCSAAGQAVQCSLGTLAPGENATVQIVAEVAANLVGTHTSSAAASAGEPDPNPSNNESSLAVQVVPPGNDPLPYKVYLFYFKQAPMPIH